MIEKQANLILSLKGGDLISSLHSNEANFEQTHDEPDDNNSADYSVRILFYIF